MGLLAKFRSWARSHAEQTDWSPDHANVLFMLPEDTALWTSPQSRLVLRQKFEWLRQNFGLVQELVAAIARHTVGKGIALQLNTSDLEWNALAEAQFEEWALTPDRCDAAGRRNFYEQQSFAVEQFIGPGEFWSHDVANPRWGGEPCTQLYDAHEIQTPRGNKDPAILDGIRVDGKYRPIEVFSREAVGNGSQFVPSPASEWVHWFKATTANQVRGTTPFAPAVSKLVNIYELTRLTMKGAKVQALMALILKGFDKKKSKGALGAIKNAAASAAGYDGSADTAPVEQLYSGAGGAIAYLDKEGDAKLLSSTSPSPLVEPFISDLLLRDVCLAPGGKVEFFWNPAKLNGTGQRFVLAQMDLLFQTLSDALIYRWIRRQVFRVLSWRMEKGLLRAPVYAPGDAQKKAEPLWHETMGFQTPPRVTVDNGRDRAAELNALSAGATTLRDIYDPQGKNYRTQIRQWIREVLEFIKIAKDEGAPPALIAKWEASLPVWRAHATGAGVAQEAPSKETKDDDDLPEKKKEDDDDTEADK